MPEIVYNPVGVVHSPFTEPKGTPIQPKAGFNTQAVIEVFPEFEQGLVDLEGFSHVYILFHLHLCVRKDLLVTPYLDTIRHGIFATRSPGRPNSIGLSVVQLERIEGCNLYVRQIDMLDGSPVLDIKPYVAPFDVYYPTRNGWLENKLDKLTAVRDDGRFTR